MPSESGRGLGERELGLLDRLRSIGINYRTVTVCNWKDHDLGLHFRWMLTTLLPTFAHHFSVYFSGWGGGYLLYFFTVTFCIANEEWHFVVPALLLLILTWAFWLIFHFITFAGSTLPRDGPARGRGSTSGQALLCGHCGHSWQVGEIGESLSRFLLSLFPGLIS